MMLAAFTAIPLGFAATASASMLVFDLDVDSCSGGCGPAGTLFGTVTLSTVDADTVHVDVDLSQALVSYFIQTGAGYALTWNGPSGETVSNMSPATGFDFLGYSDPGAKKGGYSTGGNFGIFSYAIECDVAPKDAVDPLAYCASSPGGGGAQYSDLSFDVTLSPALTLANFMATNPQGFYFSVDLLGPSGKTGVIGANSFQECSPTTPGCVAQECLPTTPGCTPSVPEPGTLALIGVSLLSGLAFKRRRTYHIV
ncbi:MAG TPA: PEP-CTERM sorting domain-containing protein [Casimicrobiaceae bacterium]|nr:PEP-CTERM sorting domain-containing protein [Casimicrobiaceae bacterium]